MRQTIQENQLNELWVKVIAELTSLSKVGNAPGLTIDISMTNTRMEIRIWDNRDDNEEEFFYSMGNYLEHLSKDVYTNLSVVQFNMEPVYTYSISVKWK